MKDIRKETIQCFYIEEFKCIRIDTLVCEELENLCAICLYVSYIQSEKCAASTDINLMKSHDTAVCCLKVVLV